MITITITITGPPKSAKSHIAQRISKLLLEMGATVTLHDVSPNRRVVASNALCIAHPVTINVKSIAK